MPTFMFISFTGLLETLMSPTLNITDEMLNDSIFYFGCASSVCLDINACKEHMSYVASKPKFEMAFNRAVVVFKAHPERLLCRKDPTLDHFKSLNDLLVANKLDPIKEEDLINDDHRRYSDPSFAIFCTGYPGIKRIMSVANPTLLCIDSPFDLQSL